MLLIKRKIIFILALFVFPILQYAQTIDDINWGPQYKANTVNAVKYFSQDFLGATNEHYYVRAGSHPYKNKDWLLKYNYDNVLLKEIELNVKHQGKKLKKHEIIETPSGDFVVGIHYEKRKKMAHYYMYQIGKENPHDAKLLFSKPFQDDGGLGSDFYPDYSGIDKSMDNNYILFSNVKGIREFKQKNNETYNFTVLNSMMELQWQQKVIIPFKDKDFFVTEINISNDGTISLLGKLKLKYKEWKNTKIPAAEFEYYLFRISKDGIQQQIKVESRDGYVHNPKLVTLDGGIGYVFGGYHLREQKPTKEHGYFLNQYNKDGKEVFSNVYPWSEEVYKEIEEEKWNGNLFAEDVYVDDNSITFITHLKKIGKDSKEGRWKHINNIIIIPSFDFKGNLKWSSLIRRSCYSLDTRNKSIKNMITIRRNNKYYIFFNTKLHEKKNRDFSDKLHRATMMYNYIRLAQLSLDGDIEVNKLFSDSKDAEDFSIYLRDAQILKNEKILFRKRFFGVLNTDYSYGILDLE